MNESVKIHIDDFALFEKQSERIIECAKNGVIDGISVFTNTPYFEEGIRRLKEADLPNKPALSVHLNLVEGKSLVAHSEIPHLTDADGVFNCTFLKLMLVSFLPPLKRVYKEEIKKEIAAQAEALIPYLDGAPLRIDSHCHYHMTPVFFEAVLEMIDNLDTEVSRIRISKENVSVYKKADLQPSLINRIKVMLLNHCARVNESRYGELLSKYPKRMFFGVLMSGTYTYETIMALLTPALAECEKEGCDMEFLIHGGGVYEPEDIARLTHKGDREFLPSENRKLEAEGNVRIREKIR